jgi:RNA polymerase sigma-70 factor (ECF subfamily)
VSGDRDGLLAALRDRRPAACEGFVDGHYRDVYRFFLWLTNNPDCAAELTQEAFAAFWESLARVTNDDAGGLRRWLFAIARNQWRKRCRRHRAHLALEAAVECEDPAPGPVELALAAASRELLCREVSRLPAELREALVLRVIQELDYVEVAGILGIGVGLARWRVHQARLRLRRALESAEEAGEETKSALGG